MKKLIIMALAALLTVGGAATGTAVYVNQPEYVMRKSIAGFVEDLGKREEAEYLFDVLEDGSLAFEASNLDELGLDEKTKTEGKLYFSNEGVLIDGFKLSGFPGINDIEADAYIGKDMIYVSNDAILDGTYGLKPGEAADELEDSPLAPESGSDIALPDDAYNSLRASLELYGDEEFQEEYKEIIEDYIKLIWDNICEYGQFESTTKDVKIGKEKESLRVVKLTLDGEAMSSIVESVFEYASEDEKLLAFVTRISETYGEITVDYEWDEDTYEYIPIKKTILELFEEYVVENDSNEIDNFLERLENSDDEIEISVVTPKLSTTLVKLIVEVDNEKLEIEFGKDGIKKTNKITAKFDDDEFALEIKDNSKDKYELAVKRDGFSLLTLKVNKEKETYTLNISDNIKVKGTLAVDGKVTTLTIDEMGDQYNQVKPKITITISTKDKMPKLEKGFTSIFEVTEKDVEGWLEKLRKSEAEPQ